VIAMLESVLDQVVGDLVSIVPLLALVGYVAARPGFLLSLVAQRRRAPRFLSTAIHRPRLTAG
jgi:hypothetical protein